MEPNAKRVKIMNGEEGGSLERKYPSHEVCDALIRWAMKNDYWSWRVMRLVSKAWNESVCSALPLNHNIVVICEYKDSRSEAFVKLLKRRRRRVKGQLLAMPFRVHLTADTFSKRSFLSHIERYLPDLTVTSFVLEYGDRLSEHFLSPLRKILQIHSETLTKLEITRQQCLEIVPNKLNLDEFKFASLKKLSIDFNEELESVLEQAIGTLEILTVQFVSHGSFQLISSKLLELLEKVPSIKFIIVDSDRNFPMKTFVQLPLPNLKKLQLMELAETEVEDAKEILSQWSSSLEEIDFESVGIPWHSLPVFSKLRLMNLIEDEVCHFEPEKFPSLEEIHFYKPLILCERWVPHLGVKVLEFDLDEKNTVVDENTTRQEQFVGALRTLGQLFPNVEKFTCDFSPLQGEDGVDKANATIEKYFLVLELLKVSGCGKFVGAEAHPVTRKWTLL